MIISAITGAIFCIWVIWFGGDGELENSAWEGMPGMTAKHFRFWAWLTLIVILPATLLIHYFM